VSAATDTALEVRRARTEELGRRLAIRREVFVAARVPEPPACSREVWC